MVVTPARHAAPGARGPAVMLLEIYAKVALYIAAAAVAAIVAALTDDVVSSTDLVLVGLAVLGAVGVYLVPNLPEGARRYAKGGVAVLVAAGDALVVLVVDGVTLSEWLLVVLAGLAAVGVVVVPNASPADLTLAQRAGPITVLPVVTTTTVLSSADVQQRVTERFDPASLGTVTTAAAADLRFDDDGVLQSVAPPGAD